MPTKIVNSGYNVILLEEDKIGKGSSSANPGLLQFSSDITLYKLAKQIGEKDAVLFYQMCFEAMENFRQLPQSILKFSDYFTRSSIYLASSKEDLAVLKNELTILNKYNFPVDYISKEKLFKAYNIKAPGALLTAMDGEINPQKFIVAMADFMVNSNVTIYENTKALDIVYKDDNIFIKTNNATITCKHLIITTGYNVNNFLQIKKSELYYTYAIVTNKLNNLPWRDKSLIWESKTPHLYARTTIDNRIMAGGLDVLKNEATDNLEDHTSKGLEIFKQLKTITQIWTHK